MTAISSTGSQITELMAMLQQLYHPSSSSSTASTSSTATDQNAATATAVSNSIAASGFLNSNPLSTDSLMTLLQSQAFDDAATNRTTGTITDAVYAKWAATADHDGNGTISKSEFEAAVPSNITQAQADQLFATIDVKGTGSVTAAQLRQGLAAAISAGPAAPPPSGGTNRLFEALDTDGDGHISLTEFENDRASGVTKAQADAVFAALDLDGDGSISPGEFGEALVENSTPGQTAANGQSATSAGVSVEQSGVLAILSQAPAGSTVNSISLLNGDFSNFLNTLNNNQQSANSIQNSTADLSSFLDGLTSGT